VPDPETDYNEHVTAVVKFLKTVSTLDKTTIGEFLGTNNKLSNDCLAEFINQYDLCGKDFVDSLRTVLLGFRLPGEGQIVDRIMETFGEKFIKDNPKGADSC
jgi:Sec7-like guanine-nucleotide exchange factor